MSYDLYADVSGSSFQEVDAAISGLFGGHGTSNLAVRIRLLAVATATDARVRALADYKGLVHHTNAREAPYTKEVIEPELELLRSTGLLRPAVPALDTLPLGSWLLQFEFTLAKPYLSKDDDLFYVAESVNPLRKDKVFKVPIVAASSWKGLLRWSAMQVRLVERKERLNDQEFARERLRMRLLFGDEKGEEPGESKDFCGFLNELRPSAWADYEQLVRQRFHLDDRAPIPHHAGRVMCYPTFFNLMDLEVINPHSRRTKAGTQPIYLECVPAGGKGTFSLLYAPFDLVGRAADDVSEQAREDLQVVAEAVQAMMLTYGFSAKRTSGFGVARDLISGAVWTRVGKCTLMRLSQLLGEVEHVGF